MLLLPMSKTVNCQKVCKNVDYQKQLELSLRILIKDFWDVYKNSYLFTTLTISTKEKYKITIRYFFY